MKFATVIRKQGRNPEVGVTDLPDYLDLANMHNAALERYEKRAATLLIFGCMAVGGAVSDLADPMSMRPSFGNFLVDCTLTLIGSGFLLFSTEYGHKSKFGSQRLNRQLSQKSIEQFGHDVTQDQPIA